MEYNEVCELIDLLREELQSQIDDVRSDIERSISNIETSIDALRDCK